MIKALKPCPFCGSTNLHDAYVTIRCLSCLAQGPATNGGNNDAHADWPDHERAVELWNKLEGPISEDDTRAQLAKCRRALQIAENGLGTLARLGNAPLLGNSQGNVIAQRTIVQMREATE